MKTGSESGIPSKISLLKDLMQDNLGLFVVRTRLRRNLEIVKELKE
jgi:hypothetical protein